jgi:O-antigen/teichoic acid export membrane protein
MKTKWATWLKRIKLMVAGGLARLFSSFSNLILSFIIVRTQSPELWGEVVPYLLILDFGFSFVNWGASPYLIRSFSLNPATQKKSLNESIHSRIALMISFTIIILFLPLEREIKLWLAIWIFSRFIYQAFDPIIQVERKFGFILIVEMIAITIVALPVVLTDQSIAVYFLIVLFTLSMLWRALATSFFFREHISYKFSFSKEFLIQSFPFLLLTFSAMLQQRADLYTAAYFLNDTETAQYQVFINLLIFCQFLAGLILSPFAKNIFRLRESSFKKIEHNYFLIGIPASLLSMIGVYIITLFYQFHYPVIFYGFGWLYILLFYAYLPQNYLLGKENKQLLVSLYSIGSSVVNLIASILLIPRYGMTGALSSAIIAQFLLVMFYQQKKLFHAKG